MNELNERWATIQRWWLGLGRKREDAEANEDGSEQKLWGTQGLLIKLKKRRWAKIFRMSVVPDWPAWN